MDWHKGILCAFDTETTSADPETALVVSACVAHVDGSGVIPPESETWLIDPGCEIPAEATAVHGITTEQARANGEMPGPALNGISGALIRSARAGIPVVAYNVPYDFTVLDRETRRHEIKPPFWDAFSAAGGYAIDPFVLDKHVDPYRKGSRSLTAACEFYRVRIDGAHDAASDAIAAARVAWAIAARHRRIAEMSLADLHALQVQAKASQSRSFQEYLRRQGKPDVIDGSWPLKALTEATA